MNRWMGPVFLLCVLIGSCHATMVAIGDCKPGQAVISITSDGRLACGELPKAVVPAHEHKPGTISMSPIDNAYNIAGSGFTTGSAWTITDWTPTDFWLQDCSGHVWSVRDETSTGRMLHVSWDDDKHCLVVE